MKPSMVVSVRMPEELHERISRRAEHDVRSLSQEIVWLLRYALDTLEELPSQPRRSGAA